MLEYDQPLHGSPRPPNESEMIALEQHLENYRIRGELIIPFDFYMEGESKQEAQDKVALILNRKNITLVDAEIYTSDGNSHPLIAPDCHVRLIEVLGEYDI
jgi:hypothetical protein